MQTIANLINGRLVPPKAGKHLDNIDPSTSDVYSRVPDSRSEDIDAAVAAAAEAFPTWSRTLPDERSRLLLRLADLIERDADRLARAESIDNGKPLALARSLDIPRAAANFRFFATAILHSESQLHETPGHTLNYTLRRPRGVAALISPWNLPLYLLTWKIAPALATGNTAVAKPSELTPMTAFLLSELAIEAGLPPGVLNIVHGTGIGAGVPLVIHPNVPAISFTGGTATGRAIEGSAGPMFKRLSLELGGKNPAVIFADADVDAAADACVQAAFRNQGEICLCASRFHVEYSVYERFVSRLVARASSLVIGDPLEPKTEQGALVSRAHLEKVEGYVALARDLGGTVHCGGQRATRARHPAIGERCKDGYFFEPTVVSGLEPTCRVEQEEIFGPVVSVSAFSNEEEAIRLANGTPFGLAASVWTRDVSRAHRVAEAIEAGIVWVNCWMVRDLRTPFGGMGQSGVGREGGQEALRFFTETKNVCVKV